MHFFSARHNYRPSVHMVMGAHDSIPICMDGPEQDGGSNQCSIYIYTVILVPGNT